MLEAVEQQMRKWIIELADEFVLSLYDSLPAGKRLRAKLVLLIADGHKDAVALASVIELIHAASLLHDDVIDEASTRRGVASVNATHDSKTAVMLGDIIYSKAYVELSKLGAEIAGVVANAVTKLSMGELMDVELTENFNEDADIYLDMIDKKTASLIEATTRSAAMLSGKDEVAHALYGKNVGLAFQIIDDILDITSDEKTLGKPVLGDYKEGKVTLPYIYLSQKCDDKERLVSLYRKTLDQDDSEWVLSEIKKHETIQQSYTLAQKLSDEALEVISGDIALEAIVHTMMKRNF
jgi:octaprenyl-diphosphate synthase